MIFKQSQYNYRCDKMKNTFDYYVQIIFKNAENNGLHVIY